MIGGHHAIGHVTAQWQQGQGTAVMKTLKCRGLVADFMLGAKHQHGATVIVAVGGNAQLAARVRKTAVCSHHQTRVQAATIAEFHRGLIIGHLHLHLLHIHPREPSHVFHRFSGIECGLSDVVIGHQKTQLLGNQARLRLGLREMQGKIRRTAHHFRVAQRVDFVFRQVLPQAILLHQRLRGMG